MGDTHVVDESSIPWSRRPRDPVRRPIGWLMAAFWVLIAFLVGFGMLVGEGRWWEHLLGALVCALSAAAGVMIFRYIRRPVRTQTDLALVAPDLIATWEREMRNRGRVEVGLSSRKVLITLAGIVGILLLAGALAAGAIGGAGVVLGVVLLVMVTFLALIPHLQFITGGRPAVAVDSAGIEIARWGRLIVPWEVIEAIHVFQAARGQANVLIAVSGAFYGNDMANRLMLFRLADAPSRVFLRNRYPIPSTTTGGPRTLAAFLASQLLERRAS